MEIRKAGGCQIITDVLLDVALVAIPLFYLGTVKNRKWGEIARELGLFFSTPKKELRNTVLLFFALLGLSMLLSILLSLAGMNDLGKVAEAIVRLRQAPLLVGYFLTVRVFSEEIFFRGFLVSRLGIFPSAVVFSLAHALYGSIAEIIGAFVLGALLGWAFKANKNIFPNILAHMAYNFVSIMAVLW